MSVPPIFLSLRKFCSDRQVSPNKLINLIAKRFFAKQKTGLSLVERLKFAFDPRVGEHVADHFPQRLSAAVAVDDKDFPNFRTDLIQQVAEAISGIFGAKTVQIDF